MTSGASSPSADPDNLKNMLEALREQLELRAIALARQHDPIAIRPSDERIFLPIAECPRSVSQLARDLGVSRQAAHASIARLAQRGFVRLEHAPGNRRDKVAAITPEGWSALTLARGRRELLEREIETHIGPARTATLRAIIAELLRALENKGAEPAGRGPTY